MGSGSAMVSQQEDGPRWSTMRLSWSCLMDCLGLQKNLLNF